MSRIYIASSWRNEEPPDIVKILREQGHNVYNFRDPPHRAGGFQWSSIDKDWESWSPGAFRMALYNAEIASHGYTADMRAMEWAECCVLVLPCGRSAHLEAGWFAGKGKHSYIYLPSELKVEPELMYLMNTHICISISELIASLERV